MEKRVKKTVTFTQNAAVIGAAVGSMPVVYIIAQGAAFNYTNSTWFSIAVGVIAIALFAAVVEYGMKVYFPYGLYGIMSGRAFQDWRTTTLFTILTVLGLSMMFASGYMSFEGRKEAANLVAGETKTKDVDQVVANIATAEAAKLEVARQEKASVEQAIQERKNTILEANQRLVSLKAEGNSWAANKLQKLIDQDSKLKQLEASLISKSETIDQQLKQENISMAVSGVSAENQLKIHTWEQRQRTGKLLVGLFGIACILIFALSSVVLVLFQIIEETEGSTGKSPSKAFKTAPEVNNSQLDIETMFRATEPVQAAANFESSIEISESENDFEIVSKGDQKAVWVSGFKKEPFSLSQCRSKLKQYENKLSRGYGRAQTNLANIQKFQQAISLLD